MLSPERSDLQALLQEGIAAVKRKDYTRGRDLLLQLVERDEKIEAAWLWLSVAVEDPQDKVTALENALSLNPNNAAARQQLEKIQTTLIAQPSAPPEPETASPSAPGTDQWKQLLPEAPLEADDNIDDPYQCVYCGRTTKPDDRVCPHCGQKLYRRVRHSEGWSEFLKMALLLIGVGLALGVLDALGPLFALNVAGGGDPLFFREVILRLFGVAWFLGNFLRLAPAAAQLLLSAYVLRFGLMLILLFGLARQWAAAYYAALAVFVLDLLFNAYLALTAQLGFLGAGAHLILGIAILTLLSASYPEFSVNETRLLTQPDTAARAAIDFYKRGHYYRQHGMWALAVAQWRKAVGLAPKQVLYQKDLGIGYAQLKRYERSLRVLEEAQRQAPQDPTIAEVVAVVREQAARAGAPAQSGDVKERRS
jgi:tetratricopeptide (TPR) repeat protein